MDTERLTELAKRLARWGKRIMLLPLLWGLWSPAAPLQWQQREGYRVAELAVPANGRTGFTLLSPEQTGIYFTNNLSYDHSLRNQNLLDGAGVAAGDYDGDGNCDLFFGNLEGSCGLFRNLGNWRFQNVTRETGVGCTNQASRATVFADINGDGYLDLLVASVGGPNACFLNNGHGGFTDVTQAAGLTLKA